MKYTGKLVHITGHENDENIKTSFTIVSVKKNRADLKVMSNRTGLFLPSELKSSSEKTLGFAMVNGGFFEMLKPNTIDEGKCYGVKAGTPNWTE